MGDTVMRIVGTRHLQHLPDRLQCRWSGVTLKYCRCVNCFPKCVYCQTLHDACACLDRSWRHEITNPSAGQDELECDLKYKEQKDLAIIQWNPPPGYRIEEVWVPGSRVGTDGAPIATSVFVPARWMRQWVKVRHPASTPLTTRWVWKYVPEPER
jgi:hypothetical protein